MRRRPPCTAGWVSEHTPPAPPRPRLISPRPRRPPRVQDPVPPHTTCTAPSYSSRTHQGPPPFPIQPPAASGNCESGPGFSMPWASRIASRSRGVLAFPRLPQSYVLRRRVSCHTGARLYSAHAAVGSPNAAAQFTRRSHESGSAVALTSQRAGASSISTKTVTRDVCAAVTFVGAVERRACVARLRADLARAARETSGTTVSVA